MDRRVSRYAPLAGLGTSGLGEVYRARDTVTGRTVALTLIDPRIAGDGAASAAFLADAGRLAKLSHPGLCAVFDAGVEDGRLFLASEFVAGERLSALVAGKPLNSRKAAELTLQMAEALEAAHAAGLVHGAMVPERVIVTPRGRPKILDLGLAAWTRPPVGALDHGPQPAALTPYTSPEQVLGRPAGAESDLYALGVILYEMLTGAPPYGRRSAEQLEVQILQFAPVIPAQSSGTVLAGLWDLAGDLMRKDPKARPGGAAKVVERLRAESATLEASVVVSPSAGGASGATEQVRATPGWLYFAAAALAAIGLLVWYLVSQP